MRKHKLHVPTGLGLALLAGAIVCVWGGHSVKPLHTPTHTPNLSPHAEAKLSCSRLGTLKLLGLAACLTDSCQAEGGWIEARPHSILLLANHLWQHGLRFNTSNPHHQCTSHLFNPFRSPNRVKHTRHVTSKHRERIHILIEMDFAHQSKFNNAVVSAEASPEGSVIITMKMKTLANSSTSSSSSFGPSSSQQSLASTPRPTITTTTTTSKTTPPSTTSTTIPSTTAINTNAAGFMSFLINGELVLIQKDNARTSTIELELFDDGNHLPSLLHIVCVGEGGASSSSSSSSTSLSSSSPSSSSSSAALRPAAVCQISVWETAAAGSNAVFRHHRVASLAVGEAVDLVPGFDSKQQQRRGVTLEISTRPPGSTKNHSETKFLEHALGELLSAQDGAPSMSKLLNPAPSLGRWIPPHAEQLLFANPHINTFLNQPGSTTTTTAASVTDVCCVARKKAKPKYHRRCPAVQTPLGIRGILRRAALGEAAWKQCGATFSTMMRHFQKAPDVFEWKTDEEKRTVIRHQKQRQQQ